MSDTPDLFTRLGGTRKMAERLKEAPSTVQSWKSAGRIPAAKQPDVLALKNDDAGNEITPEDVIFPFGRPPASSNPESDDTPSEAAAA